MTQIDRKDFAKKTLLGGVVILLPVALLVMGFRWLFQLVTDLIKPLANLIINVVGMPEIFADILVLTGMAGLCFVTGWLVTTAGGSWFHTKFDTHLARYAPGYRIMKDIVGQFFGDVSKSPFAKGEVALVKLFGDCTTEVTALVTSKHDDGRYTIFMPTGPNPTSGNIYHVKQEQVTLYPEISVSDAMRTIIACGAGSGELLANTSAVGSNVRTSTKKETSKGDSSYDDLGDLIQDTLLDKRIKLCLLKHGIETLNDLRQLSEDELKNIKGLGPKRLELVKTYLNAVSTETKRKNFNKNV
ncbi:hypothetical protein A3762_01795 [Oleiphilus sp. HI0125]|uniref:DUF502 domain-containing protein n=1 Tax=Oleiphilus sp. HI0125 TaxID=1822266 RepID=UPI0007C40BB9|nr:DUF502 domain-containing protein [Oleiphilus sp. HI0125]KZZ62835.1 hypothetical protein A3762_01795 [Oleiphilus sp. HI0125]